MLAPLMELMHELGVLLIVLCRPSRVPPVDTLLKDEVREREENEGRRSCVSDACPRLSRARDSIAMHI
jgi:hypothetical protein